MQLRKQNILLIAAGVMLPLMMTPSAPVRAQWVVIDPANLAQSILTEFNTLTTTINQAAQIANQVTQLAHEVQNLANLPAGVVGPLLSSYMNAYGQMQSTFAAINGLASNLANVTVRFNSMFPNASLTPNMSTTQMLTQVNGFLGEAKREMAGVDQTVARVAQQMATSQSSLAQTVNMMNSASGADQAIIGAGNVSANIATQVAQTNVLLMAQLQAQATMAGQEIRDRDVAMQAVKDLNPSHSYPTAAAPVAYVP